MAYTRKATKTVDVENLAVHWEFRDGTTRSLELARVPDNIKTMLALHGGSQKGGDSYAGDDSVEAAIASLDKVIENLYAGNWAAARAGGGGGPRVTLLAEALSRVAQEAGRDVSVEDAVEVISDLPDDSDEEGVVTRKSLRADPKIKAAIAAIKNERAQKEAEQSSGEGLLSAILG